MLVEDRELIEVLDDVGLRLQPEDFPLAHLLVEQHFADWHEAVADRVQHLRPLEAERPARVNVDGDLAAGDLAHHLGEGPGVLDVEVAVGPRERQVPFGLGDGSYEVRETESSAAEARATAARFADMRHGSIPLRQVQLQRSRPHSGRGSPVT